MLTLKSLTEDGDTMALMISFMLWRVSDCNSDGSLEGNLYRTYTAVQFEPTDGRMDAMDDLAG